LHDLQNTELVEKPDRADVHTAVIA